MKLDRTKPYGTVHGDNTIGFEQEGQYFTHAGVLVPKNAVTSKPAEKVDSSIDPLASTKTFLTSVLSGGPVAKASVYKESENTNMVWADVNKAVAEMAVRKFNQNKVEMWQLQGD